MSSGWQTMSESTVPSNASTTPTSSVSYASTELSIPSSYASSVLGTPIEDRIKRTKDTMKTDTNVVFNA